MAGLNFKPESAKAEVHRKHEARIDAAIQDFGNWIGELDANALVQRAKDEGKVGGGILFQMYYNIPESDAEFAKLIEGACEEGELKAFSKLQKTLKKEELDVEAIGHGEKSLLVPEIPYPTIELRFRWTDNS